VAGQAQKALHLTIIALRFKALYTALAYALLKPVHFEFLNNVLGAARQIPDSVEDQ